MNEFFPNPAPDFSDPLGLLKACHQRILRYCELLEKMIELANQNQQTEATNKEILDAANQIRHYFSTAGITHHQDEEKDLFPFLIRSSMKIAEIIYQLKEDHELIDKLWEQLDELLSSPVSEKNLPQLKKISTQFCELQRTHIEREESELFSQAQHMLSSDQLRNIGYSMEERRKSIR